MAQSISEPASRPYLFACRYLTTRLRSPRSGPPSMMTFPPGAPSSSWGPLIQIASPCPTSMKLTRRNGSRDCVAAGVVPITTRATSPTTGAATRRRIQPNVSDLIPLADTLHRTIGARSTDDNLDTSGNALKECRSSHGHVDLAPGERACAVGRVCTDTARVSHHPHIAHSRHVRRRRYVCRDRPSHPRRGRRRAVHELSTRAAVRLERLHCQCDHGRVVVSSCRRAESDAVGLLHQTGLHRACADCIRPHTTRRVP